MSYCYLAGNDVVCLPPKMQDGRMLTDYRSASLVDVSMQTKLKQPNQYEYRQFLMKHGNMIAANQRAASRKQLVVSKPVSKKTERVPERYMTVCQGNKCEVVEINPQGIGTGRLATSNWTPLTANQAFLKPSKKGHSIYQKM